MELYRKVRLACSEGMSQREAARHFDISRDSVRKMLSFSSPPGYRREKAIKRPKLDGLTEIIDAWLEADKAVHRKQRHTAKRVFERLRDEHQPSTIVTDRLQSYRAAMKDIGITGLQVCGQWLNNRAENSRQPFRRQEKAMARFRDIKTLQKFASVHASIHNHFNHQRHLNRRDTFKQDRNAALAEWRHLAA